jgi:hypothetical protein
MTTAAGGVVTVKAVELVALAVAVEILTAPVVAPSGTVALICVAEIIFQTLAATLLNCTLVTAERLVPLIRTLVPTGPLAGENEETVGAGSGATTATVTDVDVPTAPWLSVARAVRM